MGLENSVGPYSMGHECENNLVLTGRNKKTNESQFSCFLMLKKMKYNIHVTLSYTLLRSMYHPYILFMFCFIWCHATGSVGWNVPI